MTSSVFYSHSKSGMNFYSGGHDSLIFDGANLSSFDNVGIDRNCYYKVLSVKGTAKAWVLTQKFISGCGNKIDSLFEREYKTISVNDILDYPGEVIAERDTEVEIGLFIAGFSKEKNATLHTLHSQSITYFPKPEQLCLFLNKNIKPAPYEKVETITVIKGIVTYESEPGVEPLLGTKGKNASARHTKTKYSHEVKIEGNDTIDVIRVYKGSVEVTYVKTDALEEEATAEDMEKLSEDFSAGKITAIEYSTKMSEFQSYSKSKIELSKPVTVDEGFKCTVTKNSMVVELLGLDDAEIK